MRQRWVSLLQWMGLTRHCWVSWISSPLTAISARSDRGRRCRGKVRGCVHCRRVPDPFPSLIVVGRWAGRTVNSCSFCSEDAGEMRNSASLDCWVPMLLSASPLANWGGCISTNISPPAAGQQGAHPSGAPSCRRQWRWVVQAEPNLSLSYREGREQQSITEALPKCI